MGPVCLYLQAKIFYKWFFTSCAIARSKMSEKKNLRNLKPKSHFFFFTSLQILPSDFWMFALRKIETAFFLFAVLNCVLKFNHISVLKCIVFTYYFEESICWTITLKRETFIDSFIILPSKQNACRYLNDNYFFLLLLHSNYCKLSFITKCCSRY